MPIGTHFTRGALREARIDSPKDSVEIQTAGGAVGASTDLDITTRGGRAREADDTRLVVDREALICGRDCWIDDGVEGRDRCRKVRGSRTVVWVEDNAVTELAGICPRRWSVVHAVRTIDRRVEGVRRRDKIEDTIVVDLIRGGASEVVESRSRTDRK